ncbi:type II toxin-antitoxin system HipA family toxin [Spongiactinospora rosea]|uniref:Type II toxin-antitoxin system HipA family toxin n=1 Tax=Spongiactinospora rosea TaxID=2248750 RepID=A0A366LJN3_9ACTN|nr:type II toxin-antitoxin system HipA family toxin [Spongiactinospora rosea]RBQ14096.1 type II toxin-antitoxin system HipA family toxin [Spongiactinospora rosea]
MALPETRFAVLLGPRRVGTLLQRGDYTRFAFVEEYLHDPGRAILGLRFEEDLTGRHAAALRLPPWFSNLLPEGVLREWIATDRGVSAEREMELLIQVGHDLPGAVRVLPCTDDEDSAEPYALDWADLSPERADRDSGHLELRFSLAGVALKFSMLAEDHRLTLPAFGRGGDWIVKLPDRAYPHVPLNEYAMMRLAGMAGIEVPEVRLYRREELDTLPPGVWPGSEVFAYAVRRFDRDDRRDAIHIEDLAQVRGVYPREKYLGNYETVAALIYRRRDTASLREFARRLAFNVLISNGDAHLKNWSLIYRDPRAPTLSPAYDLVSTGVYMGDGETLGLKFAGTTRFDRITVRTFERLERRLGAAGAGLGDVVAELVTRVHRMWPECAELLSGTPGILKAVNAGIEARRRTLLATR